MNALKEIITSISELSSMGVLGILIYAFIIRKNSNGNDTHSDSCKYNPESHFNASNRNHDALRQEASATREAIHSAKREIISKIDDETREVRESVARDVGQITTAITRLESK